MSEREKVQVAMTGDDKTSLPISQSQSEKERRSEGKERALERRGQRKKRIRGCISHVTLWEHTHTHMANQ